MTVSSGFQAHLSETLRLAIVARLAQELNAALTLPQVLHCILGVTAEGLSTPYASLIAVRQGEVVEAQALGGAPGRDPLPVLRQVLATGLAGFVLHNARTVVINDITRNSLWLPLPDEPLSPQAGSALGVPLRHGGQVVGVLTLAHPATHYFTADAIHLTNMVAHLGGTALAYALQRGEALPAGEAYAALFDDVIVPVILTDVQGVIRSVNRSACELLGVAPAEVVGRDLVALPLWAGQPVIDAARYVELARGQDLRVRATARTASGGQLPVQLHARQIRGGLSGDYIQWVVHDLSVEVGVDQLRDDLTAMVYHDMRGPLGNIYSSVTALRRLLAEHPNPHVTTLLDVVVRSEQRVRQMIEALLDVQRLEAGRKLLNRTNTSFDELVRAAVEQVQPLADEKHVRLQLSLAEDLPLLYIDANMIERVMINLLDNAIKYSPDFGLVTLSTASNGAEVLVRIMDTGPGIPNEALERIFDKYERVRRHNMPYGVGLGLAFCKLAVEAHGGRIWAHSHPKSGSTFTLALPIDAPATTELPVLGAMST